jgi:uncharacterized protein (DUF433 family)
LPARPRRFALALIWAYKVCMNWQNFIEITPGVRSGKGRLVGTRITPADVLEYLAGGMTEDEILRDFPRLSREHVRAVLAYAAERGRQFNPHNERKSRSASSHRRVVRPTPPPPFRGPRHAVED